MELPFNVTHARRATAGWAHGFHWSGQVGGIDGTYIADGALMYTLIEGATRQVIPPTEASHQCQILLLGYSGRLEDRTHARAVGGHGFLAKDLFARLDGRSQMLRPETRGGGQKNNIHVTIDHLLVSVQAYEACIVADFHAFPKFFAVHEVLKTTLQAILKYVAHSCKDHIFTGCQGLRGSAGTAAAAAYQADTYLVGTRRIHSVCPHSKTRRSQSC